RGYSPWPRFPVGCREARSPSRFVRGLLRRQRYVLPIAEPCRTPARSIAEVWRAARPSIDPPPTLRLFVRLPSTPQTTFDETRFLFGPAYRLLPRPQPELLSSGFSEPIALFGSRSVAASHPGIAILTRIR